MLIRTLGTHFSSILIEVITFSFKKCVWKCRLRNGDPFCLGISDLINAEQVRWNRIMEPGKGTIVQHRHGGMHTHNVHKHGNIICGNKKEMPVWKHDKASTEYIPQTKTFNKI